MRNLVFIASVIVGCILVWVALLRVTRKPRLNKLIVMMGESNSGGLAKNADASFWELGLRGNVKILNPQSLKFEMLHISGNNHRGHRGIENTPYHKTHGIELELANRYTCNIVKAGQGGSKISQWDSTYHGVSCWAEFTKRVDAARKEVDEPMVIFYSQGINDKGMDESLWEQKTVALFDRVRGRYGEVPIYFTELPERQFAGAISNLAKLRNIHVIRTGDLSTMDRMHWGYKEMKIICDRFLSMIDQVD
jgi:hypothetical protein